MIIRIQNLNRPDAPFNRFSGAVSDRHLVNDGDLLFAWSGTPGTSFGAHIWRGPTAVLNQHIFNVRVDPVFIDRDYLRLAINQTLEEQIAKSHGGAGLRHVTKKSFEETEIALPPLAEQKRITEILRLFDERVAMIGVSLKRILGSAEMAHAALLQSAYDLSVLPPGRRQHYVGAVPTVRVEEVTNSVMYGTSAKSDKDGPVPVLRMGNIQRGEIDWTDLVFTADSQDIQRYGLRPGDVLFNRTNSPQLVGKTAVYRGDREAIFAGYLIRVRCSDRMLPDYLVYCLNSPAGREYCRLVKSDGVSQSNINAQKLKAFRLPCPELADQSRIVDLVRGGTKRLGIITVESSVASRLVNRLRSRLVEQALAGQLGTGDERDEPASVQLTGAMLSKEANVEKRSTEKALRAEMDLVRRNVRQILEEAEDWIPAQEAARLYGIAFGAGSEEIEPFYSELRALDAEDRLLREPIEDQRGAKLGERLRMRVQA